MKHFGHHLWVNILPTACLLLLLATGMALLN